MALASGAAEAAAANGVTAITGFTNLHGATPGTTGANELGSTRQATSWTAGTAAAPNPSNSAGLSYSLAASTTAGFVGGWSVVTAASGVYSIGFTLSPSVTTGTSAGTVTVAPGALSLAAS